ncbi:hypothetical protein ACHAXH_003118 [Discostella pseudostelligera]
MAMTGSTSLETNMQLKSVSRVKLAALLDAIMSIDVLIMSNLT